MDFDNFIKGLIRISDIIDFNELKNKVTDKDVDKFEDYIYSMYYSLAQGQMTMAEMSRQIMKYMQDNNISQEKFMNIQRKVMERYGVSGDELDTQLKSMGINTSSDKLQSEYEEARKIIGFQEKYKDKLVVKNVNCYKIKNDKNDMDIILDQDDIFIRSYGKVDLTDNELNEFICSYKKVRDGKSLKVSICENMATYTY